VYYGFDPQNPNARFQRANKLYEALAAGRPLITGTSRIAMLSERPSAALCLPAYSAREVQKALAVLEDRSVRRSMGRHAGVSGAELLELAEGEEILYRELFGAHAGRLREPSAAPRLECMQAGEQGSTDAHPHHACSGQPGQRWLENGLVNLINRMDPARFEHVVCTLRGLGPNADRLPRDRVRIQCLAKQNDSRFQAALLAPPSDKWSRILCIRGIGRRSKRYFAGRWVRPARWYTANMAWIRTPCQGALEESLLPETCL